MRISSTGTYQTLTRGLGGSLERVQELQERISSGKRINRYSDDPVGATTATRLRAQTADWATFGRASADATGWLGAADTALQSATSVLRRAGGLVQGSQNGALGDEARRANATELRALRDELADLANRQHQGQALFGGFSKTTVTRTPEGSWEFSGAPGEVRRQISPDVTLAVNLDGRELFGFGGADPDVFSVLTALADAVEAGDVPAMQSGAGQLGVRMQAVVGSLGVVGAAAKRVESVEAAGRELVDQISVQRSVIEEIDLAEAVLQLNAASAGYEAALGAAARANLPSLATFLR